MWLIRDGDGGGGGEGERRREGRVNELRDQPLYQTIFAAPPRHERRCLRNTLFRQSRGSFVVIISFAVSLYVTAEGSEWVVGAVKEHSGPRNGVPYVISYLTQIYIRKCADSSAVWKWRSVAVPGSRHLIMVSEDVK